LVANLALLACSSGYQAVALRNLLHDEYLLRILDRIYGEGQGAVAAQPAQVVRTQLPCWLDAVENARFHEYDKLKEVRSRVFLHCVEHMQLCPAPACLPHPNCVGLMCRCHWNPAFAARAPQARDLNSIAARFSPQEQVLCEAALELQGLLDATSGERDSLFSDATLRSWVADGAVVRRAHLRIHNGVSRTDGALW
jgi:hypothetical protein